MIQDIAPEAFRIAYAAQTPAPGDAVLSYREGRVLCRAEGGSLAYPTFEACACQDPAAYTYLFTVGERRFFRYHGASPLTAPGCAPRATQVFREGLTPKSLRFAGLVGLQLDRWYRANRFCGRCGGLMDHSPDERMLQCPTCGNQVYPKIAPAVIVAVRDGDRLLMTRYAHGKGWALVAGFVEAGETPEDAARREVLEETGVKIDRLRYYKSQPWGYSDSLLMGFSAELVGSDAITLDTRELGAARWTPRSQIEQTAEDFSLTNEMICAFKQGAL
ncbi:MAG: NAD(+) diphosphatase [Christensenellales bacterium]